MTTRAGITATPVTGQNGMPSDRSTAANTTSQAPEALEEAMKNLDGIGIYLSYSTASQKSLKALNSIDPDLFAQVMDSIRNASPGAITLWKHHFRNVTSNDAHHHPINSERYKRMIANAELTATLLSALGVGTIVKSPVIFQASNVAIAAETDTRIIPGDDRYAEVHAIMIHCAIVTPEFFTRVNSGIRRIKPSPEDIACIVENYDDVMRLLPELIKRQDASHGIITSLLSVDPALADGAL
jgi:hypothetical protein